jgi:hypothetical protein
MNYTASIVHTYIFETRIPHSSWTSRVISASSHSLSYHIPSQKRTKRAEIQSRDGGRQGDRRGVDDDVIDFTVAAKLFGFSSPMKIEVYDRSTFLVHCFGIVGYYGIRVMWFSLTATEDVGHHRMPSFQLGWQ